MTDLIRIEHHILDRAVLVVHTPPELSTQMGTLTWARYSPNEHAYLIDVDALPGLYAFAQHINARIIDQRTADPNAPRRNMPQECRHCAQPGSLTHPPRYCPTCGAPWDPVGPPEGADPIRRTTCTACGHQQTGRFTHCTECGATMTYTKPKPVPADVRQHSEPQLLGTLIDDVLEGLV